MKNKKQLYVTIVLVLNSTLLFAQRDLHVEDRSYENRVFAGVGNEAGIIIS